MRLKKRIEKMKTTPTMSSMKFKPMLLIGLAMLVCTTRTLFAQTTPPDGDGTVITPVTSDPTPVQPPVLTPSSQVIIVGGASSIQVPIIFVTPTVDTNTPSLVYVPPSAIIIAGGSTPPIQATNSPPVGQGASPAISGGPTIIGSQKKPFFRLTLEPIRRPIQIVRPGPPMLKPVR